MFVLSFTGRDLTSPYPESLIAGSAEYFIIEKELLLKEQSELQVAQAIRSNGGWHPAAPPALS